MARQSVVIAREINKIRTSFNRLAKSFGRLAPMLAVSAADASRLTTVEGKRPRRRPRLSPAQRKALKLQGKYMGTMRGLRPMQRKKIKALRARKGVRVAIAAALKLAG